MSDPATAPDMESLIAAVLVTHAATWRHNGEWLECECGETWPGEFDETTAAAAHQARAVLDALEVAGTVEWGIRYGDGDIDEGYLYKSEALTDIVRLRERVQLGDSPADGNEPMTLLTRRRFEHAGPWTVVEP